MNNRDELRNELYKNYDQESNTGLFGYLLSRGHKLLERSFPSDSEVRSRKILEIGGARNPHYKWINRAEVIAEYHIEDIDECAGQSTFKVSTHSPGALHQDPRYTEYFNRIIACHLWEHVVDPLTVLDQWLSMLKKGGTLSLLLPNDPGVLWGSARFFYKLRLRKNGWSDLRDYDLAVSLEHVNSVQNLIRIAKYSGKTNKARIIFWPFRIKISELNMQTIIHITKK